MRYLTLVFMLLLAATPLLAEEQTLLHGRIQHGGYGAPVIKVTTIDGGSAVLLGGQGAWLINHTFGLGIAGYGMVTERIYNRPDQPNAPEYEPTATRRLELGYGGLLLSYVNRSDELIHTTVDLLIGGGTIGFAKRYRYADNWDSGDWDSDDWDHSRSGSTDGFFVLEPSLNVEINLVRFMRLDAGMGYRWVSGVSRFGYGNADISGVTGTLALKFGKF
jgi:hypothetical protein